MAINDFISTVWSETLYNELKKEYVGVLEQYENGDVQLEGGLRFEKKDIAQVRLHVTF